MLRLPYHDRYAYSPITERRDYSWPEGKRLAVYLGLNIEHFAFGAGDGHLLTVANPPPDPRTFAWRDYGNRVGVWRCLELFDELNLPAAHLINTTVFDYAPQIVDALKARGDEFIGHGRTNAERHGHMWEADEKRFLEEVRDAITKASGKPPRGWMAPWMASTRVTPDLLKETGFDFLMDWPDDDQPLWMKTRAGPIMSVPYPIEINDSPQILVRHHSPEQFR
ncbi:MAG: polysaccharide deacetylase family protein, partial [Alphaproteobacteria bacterium]|nr:polysaccharide deacetylase family protein [Alphaproteobacteria bacterium]